MTIIAGNIPTSIETIKIKNINIMNNNVIIAYLNIFVSIKNNPRFIKYRFSYERRNKYYVPPLAFFLRIK